MPSPRDARAEGAQVAGRDIGDVRVLEPSPPAVTTGPWFADDPVAVDGTTAVVTPTSAGATTWDALAAGDPRIAEYARSHWLGAYAPLPDVPDGYAPSRDDYHRVAYAVVSNARKAATGKFGLRYTHGGFGTPFFGDDVQVRVEGTLLVVQRGPTVDAAPLTTLAAAAELAATEATDAQAEHDTVPLGDLSRTLDIRPAVGAFLGEWFGFAASVLEETRLLGTAGDDVSRVQIWPGHFDPAIEIGDPDAASRATYGCSPGDAQHAEPYLYVAPWGELDPDEPYWNDAHFAGASMSYRELASVPDQRGAALDFFARGYRILHATA